MTRFAVIALALLAACGSSYDPSYVLPVSSSLERFERPDRDELLESAGLDEDVPAPPAPEATPPANQEPPADGMGEGDQALQPKTPPKD
jgi:hypothetical protein